MHIFKFHEWTIYYSFLGDNEYGLPLIQISHEAFVAIKKIQQSAVQSL